MMHWTPSTVWFLLGLGLLGIEALAPGLVILFFGAGALITALACLALDLGLPAQVILFVCSSIACLATLRGIFRKAFFGKSLDSASLDRLDSFVGATGVVTEDIPLNASGRVKVHGSYYSAVSESPIATGENVRVLEDIHGDHSLFKVTKAQ